MTPQTNKELVEAAKECPRCKEWQRLDLSDTCPSCDAIALSDVATALQSNPEDQS